MSPAHQYMDMWKEGFYKGKEVTKIHSSIKLLTTCPFRLWLQQKAHQYQSNQPSAICVCWYQRMIGWTNTSSHTADGEETCEILSRSGHASEFQTPLSVSCLKFAGRTIIIQRAGCNLLPRSVVCTHWSHLGWVTAGGPLEKLFKGSPFVTT